MPEEFIIIPGRTSRQGTALNEGKYSTNYIEETNVLKMNPVDMKRLGIREGDTVRVWNRQGEFQVPCESGKDELPEGMVFISYGPTSCLLMEGETHGSGMPTSKGMDVWVEKVQE